MDSKVVSKALIQGTELLEQNYGSVVNAPKESLHWLHRIASEMKSNDRVHHFSVRCENNLVPRVTCNYKVFQVWHALCYGGSYETIAREYGIKPYVVKDFRCKEYTYFLDGKLLQNKSVGGLVRSIKKRHVNGPVTRDQYRYDKRCLKRHIRRRFPGRCQIVYYMRRLILKTNHGDVVAKIPRDVR